MMSIQVYFCLKCRAEKHSIISDFHVLLKYKADLKTEWKSRQYSMKTGYIRHHLAENNASIKNA